MADTPTEPEPATEPVRRRPVSPVRPVRSAEMIKSDRCYSAECAAFAAQFVTSFVLILFCMLMIAFRSGSLEVYLPLISSTAAIWVPNPKAPTRTLRDS
jgi:hypothetical protein